ncbi:HAD family hydrolase [Haematospirillum jordaniae]|uniref:HAD family hydrolase n=1 Tax=Haematospirillum jordaniae TaxID=1549855 RepID=UPI00143347B8|nr:HAD family hydrolase [Haematospirillum jordaniae]NKD44644.1 hypothetical protein [Haematospirillum jordaniae]NKD83266.1 hypothetical protein [Haematospirillum jordaniae]NKD92637.1 hypothetical protein [Haematospirillum jordaniae]
MPEYKATSLKDLRRDALSDSIQAVSFDLFDTLLLRRCQPELSRLGDIAAAQAKALSISFVIKAEALYKARLRIQKDAFERVQHGKSAEVTHAEMIRSLRRQCNLPPEADHILAKAEIEWECRAVKANRELATLCTDIMAHKPVILTSDMYLPETALRTILQQQIPRLASLPLVVSADRAATKRSGKLFHWLIKHLGVPPSAILHTGDNMHSDVHMAAMAGLEARWLPRSHMYRTTLALRDTWTRKRLRQRGWIGRIN